MEKKLIKFNTIKNLVDKYGRGHRINKQAAVKLQEWLESMAEAVISKAAEIEKLTLYPEDIDNAIKSAMFAKAAEGPATTEVKA